MAVTLSTLMMDAEQKAAFLAARCGYLTASNMAKAMSFLKNGQPSAERTKLMYDLLAERTTGYSMTHVVTEAMEHGTEYEDEAADKFVELTGRDLRPSRIYQHPTIAYFSASPDRELDDGLVEIKAPTTAKFLAWRLAGVVPEEHKPQLLAQLACSGKKWCGFLAYDPRITDESKRLFMQKFVPEPEAIAAIEAAAVQFLSETEQLWEQFTTA